MKSEPGNRSPVTAPDESTWSLEPSSSFHAAPLVELLRSIAHDLRTPSGVVAQSFAELRDPDSLDPAASAADIEAFVNERRRLLSAADCGVRRLARMADTLTLLAALEMPDFALHVQLVDLVDLVRESSASAIALEPRDEVRVDCDVGSLALEAIVDRTRLGHAVTELVINAVRHARGRVRVALHHARGDAHITIEDDGSGVPASERSTLFHRLTGRASGAGLGVGLSVARDVVRAHRGTLALAPSTLPAGRSGTVGAGFVCTVPLGLGAIATIDDVPRQDPPKGGGLALPKTLSPLPGTPSPLRVLLVDDQGDYVEMMRLMLGRCGLVVAVARSVAMAMELADSQPFDMLVSDIGLPDGTGWDLLRRLRARKHIPAIAISGSDSDADLASTHAAGFDEYFTKPVRLDHLVRAIRCIAASTSSADAHPAGA